MNLYESVRSRPTAVVDPSGCGLIVPGDPAWNNDPAAPPPAKTEKSAVDKIMDDIASGKIRSVNELRDRAKSLKPEQQQELVEQLEERFGNPPGSGGGKGAGGDWRKYAGISWDAIRGMSKKQMEAESAKIDRAIEEPYSGPYGAFKAITNPKGTGGLMLAGATAIVGGPAIVSAAEQALIKAGQAVAVSGEAIVATGTAVVAKASELSNNPAVVRAGDTLSALAARAMDSRPGQFATGVVQGMLPGMPQATGDNWRDAGQLVGQKIDEVPGVMADLANKAATTVVDYSRNAYYWAAGGSTSAANR